MKQKNYPQIPDEEYKKALGQLTMQINAVLNCFRCYGLDILVDGAAKECVILAEQFGMRVRGKNQIIKVRDTPARRPTE